MKIKSLIALTALLGFQSCEQKKPVVHAPVSLLTETINMGNRYQIRKDSSYVNFTSRVGTEVVDGSLSAYQATIFYDPEDIESTSLTIRIGSDGFETVDSKYNSALKGEDFLNADDFPGIWFQGTDVTPTETGFYLLGTMNIKNIIKPVTVHIVEPEVRRGAVNGLDLLIAKGNLTINRKDFNLGTTGKWASDQSFADEIKVDFRIVCFSYTIDFLKKTFVKSEEGRDNPVGLVYNDVKSNGLNSGLKLVETLSKDDKYKSDDWPGNLANIGWILMVDGFGKESLPFYEMALKQNSRHLPSLLRLGDAYTIAGQHADALAHFENELSLSARARFTHIPHLIKLLSSRFDLKDMK